MRLPLYATALHPISGNFRQGNFASKPSLEVVVRARVRRWWQRVYRLRMSVGNERLDDADDGTKTRQPMV